MRRPRPRRPHSTGWDGRSECSRCAAPVMYVVDDDAGVRHEVNLGESLRGTIAARLIGQQNHGFKITKLRPCPDGYHLFALHVTTCEDPPAPDSEQLSLLPDQPEGTTHP